MFKFSKKQDGIRVDVNIDIKQDTKLVPVEEPKEPEPDMATKPADIVGYCFGFACPNGHVDHFFESITVDRFGERRVCDQCGYVSEPATIKRTAVAMWRANIVPYSFPLVYERHKWHQFSAYDASIAWNKFEFLKFLNDPVPTPAAPDMNDCPF